MEKRYLMIAMVVAAFLIGASPEIPTELQPRADLAALATGALEQCLATPGSPFPLQAAIVPAPVGLTHGDVLVVALASKANTNLFLFRGTGNDLVCGVAIYGIVDPATQDGLISVLDKHRGWLRRTPPPNPAVAALPIKQLSWEDSLAPSLAGAMMTVRAPVEGRPTLEVAVRSTLIR